MALSAHSGLSEAEAARRLKAAGERRRASSGRSYTSIVRANVLTVFNLILATFGIVTLVFGDARDALFLGIIVANSVIGITQEVRAKHALERLSLLAAPHARVIRDGATRYSAAVIRSSSSADRIGRPSMDLDGLPSTPTSGSPTNVIR